MTVDMNYSPWDDPLIYKQENLTSGKQERKRTSQIVGEALASKRKEAEQQTSETSHVQVKQ